MRKKIFAAITLVVLLGVLTSLAACGKSKPTDNPDSPDSPVSHPPSPLNAPPNSPVAAPQKPTIPGPAFALDQASLQAGGTHVKGQGPAGIPIVIVDVTLTGQQLGTGFIDAQGNFDIELTLPLTGGNRIGIMAGAAQPMSEAEVQAYLKELYQWKGAGARSLLHIGLLFDTAMVPE